ncbi:MAG: acyl-CoA dehydratase activase-related protein [Bacillota bacterium]
MRVTFPHMGSSWVGIRYLLSEIGFDVVVPPAITRKTLELGVKVAPESICLPFKVNLGNYLEAIEAGADVIFMVGGIGPCRLGYYAEVQREILEDLGLGVEVIVLERDNFVQEIAKAVRSLGVSFPWSRLVSLVRFCLAKVSYLDRLEAELMRQRYREKEVGACTRLFEQTIRRVDQAASQAELRAIAKEVSQQLDSILKPPSGRPLKIAVLGEIYMLIERSVNLGVAEKLGELGAIVERNMYSSHWVKEHLIPDFRMRRHARHIERLARPYLPQRVGGHGLETIGNAVHYSLAGFDGVVQVLPLTCMPEIIAESILPTISRDLQLPSMTLALDEHSAEAGVQTRLEAFLDMLGQRQARQETAADSRHHDHHNRLAPQVL